MKKMNTAARYLLGIIFLVFGVTGLLMEIGINLMPQPSYSAKMIIVVKGFEEAGYLLPLVKIIETVVGVLFLSGAYTNLAIVMILPIAVNILGIHLFVEPNGLPVAIIVAVALAILIKARIGEFKKFLLK